MPNQKQERELHAIIEDVKERLSFLNELGVERIDNRLHVQATKADSESVIESSASVSETVPHATPTRNVSGTTESEPSGPLKFAIPVSPPVQPKTETLFDQIASSGESVPSRPTETLEDVWNETRDCTRCPLCEGRTHVVNSEGNTRAQLMFVGEAPGADEDIQARPFVGRAGQLLIQIIESIGLKREDVFIGNVNRCRPPQNRAPTISEAATCKPFIVREIDIVKPRVIVVLGNVAMKNLLDTKEGITKLRGKFQDYRGIRVMPTFHPAYLLRDPSKKRETWEDMKTVRDYLNSSTVGK